MKYFTGSPEDANPKLYNGEEDGLFVELPLERVRQLKAKIDRMRKILKQCKKDLEDVNPQVGGSFTYLIDIIEEELGDEVGSHPTGSSPDHGLSGLEK